MIKEPRGGIFWHGDSPTFASPKPASLILVSPLYRRLFQVEAEYRAALNKGNVGKVAVSDNPQAKAIVEGFRM